MSLFGVTYQYSSTHSQILSAFARTSSGADHHRIVTIAAFGHIENDYDDYLGTGQPLKTDDDLKAFGAGVHFVIKPKERLNVNLEYAQGIGDSRGVYLKLGYAW